MPLWTMECIRGVQATLEELAEFPDEEMVVDVVGKGFPGATAGVTGWVGFELCGLVLFFKPDSCVPALNNELSYQ